MAVTRHGPSIEFNPGETDESGNIQSNSQREIEQAVAKAIEGKQIAGTEAFPAHVTLEIPGLRINVKFDGEIRLQ